MILALQVMSPNLIGVVFVGKGSSIPYSQHALREIGWCSFLRRPSINKLVSL
jgi:hypothetical protein